MFLILFSVLLLAANIYCLYKKKYLYLFIPCMLFLPEYYGLELSEKLPIITVTRIMFVIFYIYAFINRKRNLSVKEVNIKALPKEYLLFAGYFFFRIVANLYYITTYGQAAKTILSVIFEQFFFLIAVYMLDPDQKEINTLLKVLVWSATVLFFLGVLESFTFVRPFDQLYTVSRDMLNIYYVRLGLLRSTTTMAIPNRFGNMCVMVLPMILYLYESTGKKLYFLSLFLNVMAIIHSGCRSDMIFFVAICFIYFVWVIRTRNRRKDFLIHSCILVLTVVVFAGALSFASKEAGYYYSGTVKSLLNEVGFNYDLSEDAPSEGSGYGNNQSGGSVSRIRQFTGIEYALSQNPLFGLGSGAQVRKQVKYFMFGDWYEVPTIDVGLVEILMTEGITGFIGYCCLILAVIIVLIRKKTCPSQRFCSLLAFSYLLCTLSTANMPEFMMVITMIILFPQTDH